MPRKQKAGGHHRKGMTAYNKGKTFPPEVLTTDEALALIKTPSRRAPTGLRNGAMLCLMWRAGLRVQETLDLYPRDLDEDGTLRVRHGKGDKFRTLALDLYAQRWLEPWLERRKALGLNGRHPMFCTLEGKELQPGYVRQMIKRMGTRAGITKRVHPHGLRHSYAASLTREGFNVVEVQQALGHSTPALTFRYLKSIAPPVEKLRNRPDPEGD